MRGKGDFHHKKWITWANLTDVIQVAEFYKFVHPDAYYGPRWYMVEGTFFPGDTKNHARIFRGFSFLLLHFLNSQNILPHFFPGLLEERSIAKFGGGPYTALYRCGPALPNTSRQPPTGIPRVTNRGLTGSVEQLPQWNWNRLKMMWTVVVSSFLNLFGMFAKIWFKFLPEKMGHGPVWRILVDWSKPRAIRAIWENGT